AFRGFGANQAQFAMEGVVDRLAELAGLDGWTMRSRNVVDPGDVWGPGQVMDDGCRGARECLDAVRPAYERARAAGRSEEHTSELQSRQYLVCRLLLEK